MCLCVLFLYTRQSSLWPPSIKTCQSVTLWRCHRSRWWTAIRSGWCKQTFPSLQQSDRVNRPCTIHTPRTGKVTAYTTACSDTPNVFFSSLTRLPPVTAAALRISPCHLPPALHHLWRLGCRRRPLIHPERHQLAPPQDSLPLQCKSCLAPPDQVISLPNLFLFPPSLLKYSVPALLISMASGARFCLDGS